MNRIIYLLSVLILISCSDDSSSDENFNKQFSDNNSLKRKPENYFPFSNDLEKYFYENFGEYQDKVCQDMLFIPINACSPCVDSTIHFFKKEEFIKPLCIILTYDSNLFVTYSDEIAKFQENHTVFLDSSGRMFSYDIDVEGPTYFRRKNDSLFYHKLNMYNAKKHLKKYLIIN